MSAKTQTAVPAAAAVLAAQAQHAAATQIAGAISQALLTGDHLTLMGIQPHDIVNRPINRRHVERLKTSLQAYGFLTEYPILIDTTGGVVDGQHRFTACAELGIAPVYRFTAQLTPDIARDTGKTAARWSGEDDLRYAASGGNESAQRIVSVMNDFKACVDVVCAAFGVSRHLQSLPRTTPEQEAAARKVLTELQVFSGISAEREIYGLRRILSAYLQMKRRPGFSYERLKDRLAAYGRAMYTPCTNTRAQLQNLIDIYNYRTPDTLRLSMPPNTRPAKGERE